MPLASISYCPTTLPFTNHQMVEYDSTSHTYMAGCIRYATGNAPAVESKQESSPQNLMAMTIGSSSTESSGESNISGGLWSSRKIFLDNGFQVQVALVPMVDTQSSSSLNIVIESGSYWNIVPVEKIQIVDEEEEVAMDANENTKAMDMESVETTFSAGNNTPVDSVSDTEMERIQTFMAFTGEDSITISQAFLKKTFLWK